MVYHISNHHQLTTALRVGLNKVENNHIFSQIFVPEA